MINVDKIIKKKYADIKTKRFMLTIITKDKKT